MKNKLNPQMLLDISNYMSKSERQKQVGRRLLQLLIDKQLKNSNHNNV